MKKYLIIGASSGIGRQLALNLASAGNQVYGTYFKHPQESENPLLEYHYLDVMGDELDLSFVPETLDGLVYCPGSINLKPFARIKPQAFINDFQLQVGGAIRTIQSTLPNLKSDTESSIVLFSTVAVQTGFNFHSQVAVSKGAIEGLTKSLAAEFATKIRVNCIAPSLTDTPLAAKLLRNDDQKEANAQRHPLKRIGTASDIAEMAAFLLSDKSSWISGQVIHVDGGMSNLRV